MREGVGPAAGLPTSDGPDGPRPWGRAARRTQVLVVASLIALAGVGVGARFLADFEWGRVVDYRTPYAFGIEPGGETPRLVDRVVLVVVDGLRLDEAQDLSTFRSLGEQGSFVVSRTSQPSLSLPGWTALTTGAPPEVSGVTTNSYEGRVEIDSLFDSASRSGVTTAVAGDDGWEQLYGDVVDAGFYVTDAEAADPRIGREALRLLRVEDPALLVVHLRDVDERGHESGVGDAYRAAAMRADRIIGRIVEAAGESTAFVLTSDHGHLEAGGHGGPEDEITRTPLVLYGDGLVPGARGEVHQSDVAPTVAALLGISRPTHAVGSLRVELLDADEEERALIEEAHEEVAGRFFERATAVLAGRGRSAAAFENAREERLRHDLLARLPIALALIGVLAVGLTLSTRRVDGAAIALGAVVFFAAWAALFFGRGLTFSFSHFNTEDQVRAFLLARMVDAGIAIVVGGLAAGLVTGRRRTGAFRAGLGVAAWVLFILGLAVTGFLTIFGWGFTWRLPNLSAGFAQFLALLTMFAVGLGAGLAALAAAGTARLVRPRSG